LPSATPTATIMTADHHVVCRRCGQVEDLDAPADFSTLKRAAQTAGFDPMQIDVVVSGLCANRSAARA
jgi:Fe2+ or Zn2+ uptake regulation protein